MAEGLTRRQGLPVRARLANDIEEDFQQDDEEGCSSSDDDETPKLSRFGSMVTSCVPPLRERMMRCEQRSCSASRRFVRGQRSFCSGMFSVHSFCRLWQATYSTPTIIIHSNNNKRESSSTETAETDEETHDLLAEKEDETHVLLAVTGPSVIVPNTPKLLDYSACRAEVIPNESPEEIRFTADLIGSVDDADESSSCDPDMLMFSKPRYAEQRIQFFLQVPKTKRHGKEPRAEVTVSPFPSSKTKLSRKTRRRSNSSDTTDVTPRNTYMAPFPFPMSRENSVDRLESLSGHASPHTGAPIQKRRLPRNTLGPGIAPAGSSLFREESTIPVKGNNASEEDEVLAVKMRQAYSDDELDTERKPRRRVRIQRRSSFVAGSKIERFDGNEGRCRKNHPNSAESYTEWKLDLMVNG
jgi:hypothetical protein